MTKVPEDKILIGKISSVHGVKGWVKIHSYTEPRENIMNYQPWLISMGSGTSGRSLAKEIKVTDWRPHAKTLVAKLSTVDDRNAAEMVVGAQIYSHRDNLEVLGKDEYYWNDLEGLKVETLEGVFLGKISHLVETGANDVMVVVDEGRERLLPYLPEQVVVEVNLTKNLMRVDWDPDF